MAQNKLLCSTKEESIAELVFWARNLQHFDGVLSAQAELDYWQYPGNPPASRVINGTHYTGTDTNVPTFLSQWTLGCHGTSGFLKSMLRAIQHSGRGLRRRQSVGVVSERRLLLLRARHGSLPLGGAVASSHGDDPYIGTGYEVDSPVPAAGDADQRRAVLRVVPQHRSIVDDIADRSPGRRTLDSVR